MSVARVRLLRFITVRLPNVRAKCIAVSRLRPVVTPAGQGALRAALTGDETRQEADAVAASLGRLGQPGEVADLLA